MLLDDALGLKDDFPSKIFGKVWFVNLSFFH